MHATSIHRHAIFAAPPRDDPLTALAARWLGRDAWTGETVARPDEGVTRPDGGLDAFVAAPRRYGFHATIVAPFRPASGAGADAVDRSLETFCAGEAPIPLPLRVGRIGPFFALVPDRPSDALDAMEARAVRHFHPLRATPTPDEIARRNPERLTDRQRALLQAWHYPYVLDEFRYHMTLTGPVPDDEVAHVGEAIAAHFPPGALTGFTLDGLARFVEPGPGAPFTIARWVPFTASAR